MKSSWCVHECVMSVFVPTCVFSLHRSWGLGSGENSGGECSLQRFPDLAQWHTSTHCLCFPVNTLLINTECLSAVLPVLLFVFPADRRARFRFLICSPRLAVISDMHTVSVIGILFAQVVFHKAERWWKHEAQCRGNTILFNLLFSLVSVWICEWGASAEALCRCQSALTGWWKGLSA